MIRPRLIFIAGANGSGKTTLTRWNALFKEIPLLDPDAIANTLQATTTMLPPIAAARQVIKSAAEHLTKSESFAIETTLSGKTICKCCWTRRLADSRSGWFISEQKVSRSI